MPLIEESLSLKNFTTFKVGGAARYFSAPNSVDEIQFLVKWAKDRTLPIFILGKGSNLVVSDHGYEGLVIHLGKNFSQIHTTENRIQAQAGALLNSVVTTANRTGLGGIECLGGIPGTIGAGAWINAGAYGQELEQSIVKVTSLCPDGTLRIRNHHECGYAYRHSAMIGSNEIIVAVELNLKPADPSQLQSTLQECLIKRKEKQPLELPNAGSMFKRPAGYFAGALIEQSGLKGYRVGDAQVSEKHAGFVVNLGKATANDIWQLTEGVIQKIKKDHHVTLEREVVFLGDFNSD